MASHEYTPFEGKHSDVTGAVLHGFYAVYGVLGFGFSEQVYENALVVELRRGGLEVRHQVPLPVYYHSDLVGEYVADLVVRNSVIVELKSAQRILPAHEAQLLNYLRATPIEVGLLLNFGPRPGHIRRVYDNARKTTATWRPQVAPVSGDARTRSRGASETGR